MQISYSLFVSPPPTDHGGMADPEVHNLLLPTCWTVTMASTSLSAGRHGLNLSCISVQGLRVADQECTD
eukprot:1158726-Pelagomonas_calceolata.AAC.7